VWRATPLRDSPGFAFEETQLLWYVAVTEWIVFRHRYPYRGVESDILRGRIGWLAARPLSYTARSPPNGPGRLAFG